MILALTLVILVVLSIFSVILGNSFIGTNIETVIGNDLIINGTTTTVDLNAVATFSIDPFIGLTTVIVVLIVLAIAVGIQIIGSGLSPTSVRVIIIGTAYIGLWVLFSIIAEPLISSIEIFGALIYITLTMGYVYGVVQQFSGGGDE